MPLVMQFGRKKETPPNLPDFRPARNLQWEAGENGRIVLLVPRFQNRLMVRWFVPLLAAPDMRVKLDSYGSFVWNRCDGNTPVSRIGEEMAVHFGEPLDSMCDRTARFIHTLMREKFVTLPERRDPPAHDGQQGCPHNQQKEIRRVERN